MPPAAARKPEPDDELEPELLALIQALARAHAAADYANAQATRESP